MSPDSRSASAAKTNGRPVVLALVSLVAAACFQAPGERVAPAPEVAGTEVAGTVPMAAPTVVHHDPPAAAGPDSDGEVAQSAEVAPPPRAIGPDTTADALPASPDHEADDAPVRATRRRMVFRTQGQLRDS